METPFGPIRRFTMSVLDSMRKMIPNDPCSTEIIAREIEKLQRSLMWIKATLAEAENREIKDKSIKLWVRELREIAYDSEDIMEEYNYEVLRSKVEYGKLSAPKRKYDENIKDDESSNDDDDETMPSSDFMMQDQMRGVILSGEGMEESYDASKAVHIGKRKHNDVEVNTEKTSTHVPSIEICDLIKNIRELRRKFHEIRWFRKTLRLKPEYGPRVPEALSKQPTSSLLNDRYMVGRELDKEEIIKMLLLDNDSNEVNISVIPIVGMAGLGKTALAQLVYNDQRVINHFKLRMWVHVSENSDLTRITNALIESITRERSRLLELDPLQRELSEKLDGVCFMLVLDDVWNENKELWMTLRAPLYSCAKGSKILITTRSQQAANVMCTGPTYNLRYLSDDQCWSLLSRNAFVGLNQCDNQNLVEIGRRIAAKCKGLPLTVRVLSELLRNDYKEEKWEEVLESDMWGFSECENSILPLLKLSYNHLPTQIKRSFSYCSIFPKGYVFERDKLIQLWIAHDFIESCGGNRRVEDIGDEYINVLFSRSFFQYCDWKSYSPNFVMHDLIHDLAESVSEKGYFRIDVSTHECNKMGQQSHVDIFSKVRHCVVLANVIANPINFKPFCEATSLRTLYLNKFTVCRKYPNALINLTQKLKYLRALHLNSENLTELPESFGQLKSLRYLMVIARNLKHLPDSISCLYNLKTLRLHETVITRLPKGISKLVNLRHLDLPEWGPLPKGFGRLRNLQSLQSFTITRRLDSAGIEELKDLNPRGTLEIRGLEKVLSLENVKRANLQKKDHIRDLNFKWGNEELKHDEIFKSLGYDCRKAVLKTLEPHTNLHGLEIQNYISKDFPAWVGHTSFNKLVKVRLFQCSFQEPPTLGTLSSLKILHIENISGIQYIGRQFFVGGFPSLELLGIHGLRDLRGWCGAEMGELFQLKEVNISNCCYLTSLALDNLKSLEKVGIHTCPMLSSLNLPNSKYLGLRHFSSLTNLEIVDCSEYIILSRNQLPPYLQLLNIHNSERLVDWCRRNVGSLVNIYKVKGMNKRELVLTNVSATNEARNIYFDHVRDLHLKWDPTSLNSRGISHDAANEILNCLCPKSSLTNLIIEGYIGSQFPYWLGNPQFSNVVYIRLTSCPNCTMLPPLGQLPYLMELYLDKLIRVKTIGNEFYGNGTSKGFPSLRTLELTHMNGLYEWWGSEHGEFPTLQEFRISDAGILRGLPCFISTLKEIKIKDCPNLILDLIPSNYSSLQTLCASHVHSIKLSNNLTSLTELLLDGCLDCRLAQLPSVQSLAVKAIDVKAFLDSLQGMNSITSLKISSLTNLTMIPLHDLPFLTNLDISNCPQLVSIICFSPSSSSSSPSSSSSQDNIFEGLQSLSSLKFLSVGSCPCLSFSVREWLPISLEAFKVFECLLVKSWCHKYPNKVSHIRYVSI